MDWTYTLVTGTNREKTWEEISTPANTITEEQWVQLSVLGEAALQSVLDRLPEGETVNWLKLRAYAGQDYLFGYPDQEIVSEIATYSQQHKISLSISSR